MVVLKGVSKIYGLFGKELKSSIDREFSRKYALHNINLVIETGETVAITGKSGSGKTTLLNLIGAMDSPLEGTIQIDGEDITGRDDRFLSAYRRKYIGYVFQFFHLFSELTVKENILLPLRLNRQKAENGLLEEIAEKLGIQDKLKSYPEQLSGGQKQRTATGRAIIHKPKLLLADEPTGNLDSKMERTVIELLKDLVRKYNTSILFVTHNESLVKDVDRVIRLEDGEIVYG